MGDFFKKHFLKWKSFILTSLKFLPRIPLTNWFQVQYTMSPLMMAWCFQWKPFYSLPHYKGLVYELISPKTKMAGISKSISLNKTWEIDENIQWVLFPMALTHWGWVTNICVSKLGHHWFRYNNGLSSDRPQAIIRTNAGIMLIEPLRTNFSELFIQILTFSFNKIHLKVSSVKWPPFCLSLNVFITIKQPI